MNKKIGLDKVPLLKRTGSCGFIISNNGRVARRALMVRMMSSSSVCATTSNSSFVDSPMVKKRPSLSE